MKFVFGLVSASVLMLSHAAFASTASAPDFSPVSCVHGMVTPDALEMAQTQWMNGFVALSSKQHIKGGNIAIDANDVVRASYPKDMMNSDALKDYLRLAVRADNNKAQEDGWSHAAMNDQIIEANVTYTGVYGHVVLKDDAGKSFEFNVRSHYECINNQIMITQQAFVFQK